MPNQCMRCTRSISDPDAAFGWYCARLLGVSKELNTSGDRTYAAYMLGVKRGTEYLRKYNIDTSHPGVNLTAFYEANAVMALCRSMGDEVGYEAARQAALAALGRGQKDKLDLAAYMEAADQLDYSLGNFRTDAFLGRYNEDVAFLQQLLNEQGHTDKFGRRLKEDGRWGANTQAAADKGNLSYQPTAADVDAGVENNPSVWEKLLQGIGDFFAGLFGLKKKKEDPPFVGPIQQPVPEPIPRPTERPILTPNLEPILPSEMTEQERETLTPTPSPTQTPQPTSTPTQSPENRTAMKNIEDLHTTANIIHTEEMNVLDRERLTAYDEHGNALGLMRHVGPDQDGWTYGWGHHANSNGDASWCESQLRTNFEGKQYWPQSVCDEVFQRDVAERETRVKRLLSDAGVRQLNQNQFDALMQLHYLGIFKAEGAGYVARNDSETWKRRLYENQTEYHSRIDRALRLFYNNDLSYYR